MFVKITIFFSYIYLLTYTFHDVLLLFLHKFIIYIKLTWLNSKYIYFVFKENNENQ